MRKPIYSNIDTMWKLERRVAYVDQHSRQRAGEVQGDDRGFQNTIVNIHLLSNFEPFRWGDPSFVRETNRSFVRIGIGGVHVYPLRYWDWPNSADKTDPLLNQTDRDWIWFASWARYSWNPERDAQKEHSHWATQFARRFGVPNGIDAQGTALASSEWESVDTFAAEHVA